MAGSIVQTKESFSVGSGESLTQASGTLTTNPISGNFLLVIAKSTSVTVGATPSCSDTRGLIWTDRAAATEPAVTQHLRVFTAPITGSGPCDVTVNYGILSTGRGVAVFEVTGVSEVQAASALSHIGDNNVTPTSSVIVTAQPAYAVLACVDLQGAGGLTPSTGWTLRNPNLWVGEQPLFVSERGVVTTGALTGYYNDPAWDRALQTLVAFTETPLASNIAIPGWRF